MKSHTKLKAGFRLVVDSPTTTAGRAFDIAIQVVILISIIGFTLETLPSLSSKQRHWLSIIEATTVGVFTLEYLLRIWVADSKKKYLFSFYGIVDFLAIAPFYLALGVDLRTLRVVRLFRIFSLLKFVRYSAAMRRAGIAFTIAKSELVLYLSFSCIVIFLAGVGIYHFESTVQPDTFSSLPSSLWWAVVTLTTVGYGDMLPITLGGRIFTVLILLVGLGLVAVPAGIISSALSEARRLDEDHIDHKE